MSLNSAEVSRSEQIPVALLLILIFSLAFMQPSIQLFGSAAVPTDLIFLALGSVWAALVMQKRASLVWDRAYLFIGLYFLALLVSVPGSESLRMSLIKILTQIYLLSLPVLVCSLITDEARLRTAVRWWLVGTGVMSAAAILCLALFSYDPASPVLQPALSVKGTLPAGNYPRLQITFLNPNMACNYLTVSLMIQLAARRAGWIGRWQFQLLLASTLVAAATTISPGLGGIFLGAGIWGWLLLNRRTALSRMFLIGGAAAAVLFLIATIITPIIHPTAPYLIRLPLTDFIVAPSGRLMIWTDAVVRFLADPLTGRGIGVEPVLVNYLNPSGGYETSTDAHNAFLSIAVQCGIIGLAALLALMWHIVSRTLPLRIDEDHASVMRVGIGIGLLLGLVYEGLSGSFEDARHLWVAFGLLLASDRIARERSAAVGGVRR